MIYFWLFIIVVSLIVEASTAALVSIWFIPPAVVSALLARLGAGVLVQVLVFLFLSIVFLILARKIFSRFLRKDKVRTNADSLIGERAVVIEEVDNLLSQGLVKVKGQTWSAKSENGENIPAEALATVVKIEGVKLVLRCEE